MSRLIDADALYERAYKLNLDYIVSDVELRTLKRLLSEEPTAEIANVTERKKGKWSIEETNTYELSYGVTAYAPVYKCSACGRSIESHLMLDEPIVPEDANFSRFCPWCGADMRGDGNETNRRR